jgi:hypothetical protein
MPGKAKGGAETPILPMNREEWGTRENKPAGKGPATRQPIRNRF